MNKFSEQVHPMTEAGKGRQAQKEATRARILDVARLHFERDGFEPVNVRTIAAEAGVAAGTVLLHFTDKKGLLHAALHDDLERAIARSLNAAHRGGLLARLCAVVRPFFEYYAARPSLSKTLLRESLLAAPPWQARFTDQAKEVHAHVTSMVEKAKADGQVAPDADAGVFAAAVFSFYYFALIGWVQDALDEPMPLFKRLLKQHIGGAAVTERKKQ